MSKIRKETSLSRGTRKYLKKLSGWKKEKNYTLL